jgi:hypothetical protein
MEILPHSLLEDERIQIAKLRPTLGEGWRGLRPP